MPRTPIRPGEILADELDEIGLKSSHLAKAIGVEANRISQILNTKRAITADISPPSQPSLRPIRGFLA